MINLTRRVLCLDWDSRSLRLVAARLGGGRMTLEDAHSHRLPNTVEADNPEALGDFIRQMMRRHGLRHKSALVDVPRERAVINRLTIPPTPPHEVAAAVRFQAMRELPFPMETAAVDYVVTQRDEQGRVIQVLLAAVTLESLERIKATCKAAGLEPVRIGLRPYANLLAASNVKDLSERRVLFIDVGPGATEIDIFRGESLEFARSANVNVPVPVGPGKSPEDSKIISLAEIADLDASDETIAAAVEELLLDVTRTLTAYRASEVDAAIDGVIVAGGTGIETQFADALEERLGYSVALYDPTEALGVEAAEANKLRSFSAALGLAWGLTRDGALALDFLNPKRPVPKHAKLQQRMRIGTLAVVMVVVATGGFAVNYYLKRQGELKALEQSNATIRKRIATLEQIQDQVDRVDDWQVDAIWPEDLLRITEAALEPGKQMLVQTIDLEASDRNQKIDLRSVYAADWSVVMNFVQNLKGLEHGGQPIYEVVPGTWTEQPAGSKFKGRVDVQVTPEALVAHQAQAEKNEKERRRSKR